MQKKPFAVFMDFLQTTNFKVFPSNLISATLSAKKLFSCLSKAKLQKFSLHYQSTAKLFSHITSVVYGIFND